ncbi:secretory carrier-associated membrane protein [Pseudohyphozyma bogoriensis]|nr:secretory carrier-associated membrane protein [Pseudohyphozyma bogoriensis]
MSANPFADPQSHQMDSNPFDDPSVSAAQYGNRSYEDLESGKTGANTSSYTLPEDGAAANRDEMATRIDDLARRERELAAREEALTARAEHIRRHGRNNWPPGPFPLIFHDIEMEIPEKSRSTVLTLYRLWMLLIIVLIINLVGSILLLISGASNGGADLGAAIMYVPVIGVLNFLLAYRPAYNVYMKESSVFYYCFFLFGGFHLAFVTYMVIGIPSSGSAGLINLISRFATGHILAGVFCALATAGWTMQGLGSLWMYKNVWAHAHGEAGHTFAQAKHEMQMYGLRAYVFGGNKVPVQQQAQT